MAGLGEYEFKAGQLCPCARSLLTTPGQLTSLPEEVTGIECVIIHDTGSTSRRIDYFDSTRPDRRLDRLRDLLGTGYGRRHQRSSIKRILEIFQLARVLYQTVAVNFRWHGSLGPNKIIIPVQQAYSGNLKIPLRQYKVTGREGPKYLLAGIRPFQIWQTSTQPLATIFTSYPWSSSSVDVTFNGVTSGDSPTGRLHRHHHPGFWCCVLHQRHFHRWR